jgi:SAM-dependent methyltransferase
MWNADYLLGEMPGPDETAEEVTFLTEALEIEPGDRILDVACGAGRHAAPLADAGAIVVGVDTSDHLLRAAATDTGAAYARADMRALPFTDQFDIALCLFASFGLVGSDEDDVAMSAIAGSLTTGGILLIESWNPYAIAEMGSRRNWWRADGALYLAEAHYDVATGMVADHREVLDMKAGETRSWVRRTRFYTAPELTSLAAGAGMRLARLYGDFDGSEYTHDAPRLIAAFEKTN